MPSPASKLDPTSAAELLHRADRLQAAAAEVIADLDLPALVGQIGYIEQVG
jgi:hypothetical protein